MAFRTEAKTCASLMLCAASAFAGSPYDVRHEHLRHGGPGILRIDDNSISFEERGKEAKHSAKPERQVREPNRDSGSDNPRARGPAARA